MTDIKGEDPDVHLSFTDEVEMKKWECTNCGKKVRSDNRPDYCRKCGRTDKNVGIGMHLYIREDTFLNL